MNFANIYTYTIARTILCTTSTTSATPTGDTFFTTSACNTNTSYAVTATVFPALYAFTRAPFKLRMNIITFCDY